MKEETGSILRGNSEFSREALRAGHSVYKGVGDERLSHS